MRLTKLFTEFFNSEKAGGMILIGCTIASLLFANSPLRDHYLSFWQAEVSGHTLTEWINDGLMAVFFLLIGLELEREIYIGELADLRNSLLPVIAAAGGMVLPAAIHLSLNIGGAGQSGAGIPMATDIAFALGVMSLLGNRVPASLKVFLTALAVIDDLGAIIVIAIFYTSGIDAAYLFSSLGIFTVLLVLNRLRILNLLPYLAGGIAMWYLMSLSGVHATITGVLLAFAVPFGDGGARSPSYLLQHYLHVPVGFLVLPAFALANTAILLEPAVFATLLQPNSYGIMAGLLAGKPLGILGFSYAAVRLKIATLPDELDMRRLAGAGFLGGIGFTMSIFISLLAFENNTLVDQSKLAIIISSVLAGMTGFFILKRSL